MQYLNKIGVNAKRAFENLNKTNHKKIKKVLESYNRSILINKKKIIKENLKDVRSSKRKGLIDRLILEINKRTSVKSKHLVDLLQYHSLLEELTIANG